MPIIQASDGRVIAWSGILAGPIQEYEPLGTRSPWVRYEAEVGIGDPETAKVVVRVQQRWRDHVRESNLTLESSERELVSKWIQEYVSNDRGPLTTGTTNNFTIYAEEMLERYRSNGVGRGMAQ